MMMEELMASIVGLVLFLSALVGSLLAGLFTDRWLHGAIQRAQGTLEAQWERPNLSGLGVSCVSQLLVEGTARVNLTTPGPCAPSGPTRASAQIDLCKPRHRPELARICIDPCGGRRSCEDEALAGMIAGWVILTPALLALLFALVVVAALVATGAQRRSSDDAVELAASGAGQQCDAVAAECVEEVVVSR
jgi:hypothetical protein